MNLENYSNNYIGSKASIEERFMTKASIELAKEIVKNKKVLNLGLGNALTSKVVANLCRSQVTVEGSKKIIELFSFPNKKTSIKESLFEDFNSNEKFDVILANHVLEHVKNPVDLMKIKFHEWLNDDGLVFITVPNAHSIHRRIGKEMGLLNSLNELNSSDLKAGHQRVYDLNLLKNHINKSDFEILEIGGYNIKLTSLLQMKDWSQDLLDAIFKVSLKLPTEICTNLWVKAKKKL